MRPHPSLQIRQMFLFTEDCEAWVHGPVYRDIYFRYRDYHYDPIEKAAPFDTSVFSAGEKTIFDGVINPDGTVKE